MAGERIAALFGEHVRMVFGVSRLLLRDPVEAEDAAQQTFLSAYRSLLAGQEPRDPSAWLGTIEVRTHEVPLSVETKIGALAPPIGSGVNALIAISFAFAGFTAMLGSLS